MNPVMANLDRLQRHASGAPVITQTRDLESQFVGQWLSFIQDDTAHRERVERVRETGEGKNELPYAIWAGVFRERKAAALREHSGYVYIDVDEDERPAGFAVWRSVGGKGWGRSSP